MVNFKRKGSLQVLLLCFIVLLILTPFIPLVLASITPLLKWPQIFPEDITLRSWTYVFFNNPDTWVAVWNSFIIAIFVTVINIALALPCAHALARMKVKGKVLFQGFIYAPIIIPPFISIMGMHTTFISLGLTETIIGVIIAHIIPTLPYMVRALVISFSTLGNKYEEQATMLGATRSMRVRYIIFPMILPGVITGASLSILISLSQYLITFLVSGGQVITLPLLLFPFINGGDQAIASVYTILFSILAIGVLFLMDLFLKKFYGKSVPISFVRRGSV
ncbi:ABC transporter permease [Lottiidibacillus patelloidae]|uniref:ABC transporter permease n=1 Tax=Lottiidibacillus patelloidae TaxID=2670334 RepID=A0A263BW28_9BACI|nr:ABC transporter permease subunit [Lottiidibacillus patelloidae]OZM57386.1 ABC transporter permease [Lottiidibacillus patelloidae]